VPSESSGQKILHSSSEENIPSLSLLDNTVTMPASNEDDWIDESGKTAFFGEFQNGALHVNLRSFSDAWTNLESALSQAVALNPTARYSAGFASSRDGMLYVFGGNTYTVGGERGFKLGKLWAT
jgi:hypothetical protein